MRGIALDAHASAAAVTLLAPPEFAVDELLIDLHSGGDAGEDRNQRLSMRFSCRAEAKHKS